MIFNPAEKSCCVLKLLERTEILGPAKRGSGESQSSKKHLESRVPQALEKDEVTFRPYVTVGLI